MIVTVRAALVKFFQARFRVGRVYSFPVKVPCLKLV
jgi:hypothetical protein